MRHLDFLMLRTASLRACSIKVFHQLQGDCFPHVSKRPPEIAAEARELDSAFASWEDGLPAAWKYTASFVGFDPAITIAQDNYPSHTYQSQGHATVWNRCRAFRLIVNSIHAHALATLQDPKRIALVARSQELCQQNINSISTDLVSGAQFLFNAYKSSTVLPTDSMTNNERHKILPKIAALLAWLLTVAVSTKGVPEPQKLLLLSQLKLVADALGDSILHSIIEKGDFEF